MTFSHIDSNGNCTMVDVSQKEKSLRTAYASGFITCNEHTVSLLLKKEIKKGDPLSVGKIAGIMAAKQTAQIIPLCHPIALTSIQVDCFLTDAGIAVLACTKAHDVTGVEMEALHAVQTALLTIYDMLKAVDKTMCIQEIRLLQKTGGKSGRFDHPQFTALIDSVNISRQKGKVKEPVAEIVLLENFGIEGDAHAKTPRRQVSFLDTKAINTMKAMGADFIKHGDFAENITMTGAESFQLILGDIVTVGSAIVKITQIGKECHKGCEIMNIVGSCIMPTEGIFSEVLTAGIAKAGDPIFIVHRATGL